MSGINFDEGGENIMVGNLTLTAGNLIVNGKLRLPTESLTIASGVVTPTRSYIILTGEGAAADDLNTVQGGIAGDVIFLRIIAGGATVTLKDGIGNLQMAGDFAMNSVNDSIMFICISTNLWGEVCRSNNT